MVLNLGGIYAAVREVCMKSDAEKRRATGTAIAG
jgi:hypothetical protein